MKIKIQLFVLFCILFRSISVDAQTVVVGVSENPPLIYFHEEKGEPSGFFHDILEYIAKKEGWTLQYKTGSFAQNLQWLETGEIDVMPDLGISDKRKEKYLFNKENVINSWGTVVVNRHSTINNVLELNNKKVAVVKDDYFVCNEHDGFLIMMDKFSISIELVELESYSQVVDFVKEDKCDAGIVNRFFQHEILSNQVKKTSIIFSPVGLHFAFSKSSKKAKQISHRIDYHIKKMKYDNPELYQRFLDEYFGVASKTKIPQWLWLLIIVLAVIIGSFVLITFVLRKAVKNKTKELIGLYSEAEETKKRLELALDATNQGIWDYNVTTGKAYFDDNYYTLLGYKPGEFEASAESWKALLHDDFRENVSEKLNLYIKGEIKKYNVQFKMRTKSGDYKWILSKGKAIEKNDKEEITRMVGTHIDITAQKKLEIALRNHKTNLENIVKERTDELTQANEELRSSIDELRVINEQLADEISERRQAERELEKYKNHLEELVEKKSQALVESEKKYRFLFENAKDGIFLSKEGLMVDCNSQMSKMFECRKKDLLGSYVIDFSPLNQPDGTPSKIKAKKIVERLEKQGAIKFEWQHRSKEGRIFTVEINLNTMDVSGQEYHMGIIRDITARKEAEIALRESEEKYRILFEKSKDPILLIHENKYYDCNQAALDILKINTKEQLIDLHPADISPERQPDGYLSYQKAGVLMKEAQRKGTMYFEWLLKDFNNRLIPVEISLTEIPFKGKRILYTVWRDITERKRAEEQLKDNEKRYRLLVNNAGVLIYSYDKNGILTLMNRKCAKYLNGKPSDFIGKNMFEFMSKEYAQRNLARIKKGFQTGKGEEYEHDFATNTLGKRHLWTIMQPIKNSMGEVVEIQFISSDLTEQKQAEQKQKESEQKFKHIFNSSIDIIVISDFNRNIVEGNHTFRKLFGIEDIKFEKMKTTQIIEHAYTRNLEKMFYRITSRHSTVSDEIVIRDAQGKKHHVEVVSKIIDYGGKDAILSIGHDITERKNTEQKIMNAIIETEERERKRFAEELHDGLGPLLSSIKMYVKFLSGTMESKDRKQAVNNLFQLIDESIISLKEISNLLSPHILEDFGLVTALKSFCDKLKTTGNIIFTIDAGKYIVSVNKKIEIMLYRILTELINNTIKYAHASHVTIDMFIQNDILHVNYKDNGVGFNVDEIITEENTGIGLFNMKNRIKSFKGSFDIKSHIGKGMSAKIKLPVDIST